MYHCQYEICSSECYGQKECDYSPVVYQNKETSKEIELLDASNGREVTDGIIKDNESTTSHGMFGSETGRRWTRIVRCGVGITQAIDGFKWVEGTSD